MTGNPFLKIRNGFFAAAFCFIGAVPAVHASPLDRDPASHLVGDAQSGLALFGYDPVAYHIDGRAREGRPEFALVQKQFEWRFTSMANKEAFMADPSAYIPAFGGHDGKAVSEGHMTSGDPVHFVIASGELMLFRNAEARDQFTADPDLRKHAALRWPEVARQHGFH
jgi:hypothetical protein